MYFNLKNLEIITGKNFNLEGKQNSSLINFASVPFKEAVYSDIIDANYFIYCNFQKGTGPVVLNKEVKFILDLTDGKKTIDEIFKCFSNSDISLSWDTLKYFVKNSNFTPSDIYKKFVLKKILINPEQFLGIFNILNQIGLVKFSAAQPEIPQQNIVDLTAWVHLTGRCNLACDYCYVRKNTEEMTNEQGRKFIDKLFNTAFVNNLREIQIKFAGGEPFLLLPLVLEMADRALEKAKQNNIKINLVVLSNGTLISKPAIEELRRRNIGIAISLDGLGKWHDHQAKYINGRGSFVDVERGINLLIEEDYRPTLMTVVSAFNLEGIPELIKYALKKKLRMIIGFVRKTPDMNVKTIPENRLLIETMKKVYDIIELNLPCHYNAIYSISDRFLKFNAYNRYECGAGENYILIEPDGSIASCVMSLGKKEDSAGNINDSDDLLKIIRQPSVQIRNPSIEDRKECSVCVYKYACGGGCPANAYYTYGSFRARSPYCDVYKALLPQAMRLTGKILLKYYRK